MKTVYVYLSCDSYTEEHTSYIANMLVHLDEKLCSVVEEDYREDIDALELVVKASPWAVDFLKHLEQCDMLATSEHSITADDENK